MKAILAKLKIDETFTQPVKKAKTFTKVKDNIPLLEDYNFMADILELPKDKKGFHLCLVVVDLATNDFDIEPMKNKESKTVLDAMLKMFKRKYLKKPEASITTDGGSEFKSVFQKWCYDESIYHKIALPDRHTQLANVDSLIRQLGRFFALYMNSKEIETKKTYRNWTDEIELIRTDLNKHRRQEASVEAFAAHVYDTPDFKNKPKFKVGDMVHRLLETPRDALGNKQNTKNFRMGDIRFDMTPLKIVQVLVFSGAVTYRYMLQGLPSVSYTEAQLKLAK